MIVCVGVSMASTAIDDENAMEVASRRRIRAFVCIPGCCGYEYCYIDGYKLNANASVGESVRLAFCTRVIVDAGSIPLFCAFSATEERNTLARLATSADANENI